MHQEKLRLISHNCHCSMGGDPFLMVFREIEEGRWELFQGLIDVCKPSTPPEDDELFLLHPDVLRYGVSVAPDYGCPHCGNYHGNTFAICPSCKIAFCADERDEGIIECPVCAYGGEVMDASDVVFQEHEIYQKIRDFEDDDDENDLPF